MERLSYPDQKSAQAVADRIYADMRVVPNALEPGTTAWAVPYQDTDANGKPIGSNWYIDVDERCRAYLTAGEVATVAEWQEAIL